MLSETIDWVNWKDRKLIESFENRLGISINWKGDYMEKAIKADLNANCLKIVGEGVAWTIYDQIDETLGYLTPKFNVTVNDTSYLYTIKSINCTTEMSYNRDSEFGFANTTLVGNVEVSDGKVTLKEKVWFVVTLC
jgi:hypothetical protein